MSNGNNLRNSGDGSNIVQGNNNSLNARNEVHKHSHYHDDRSNDSDHGFALLFGGAILFVVATWLFIRNSQVIYHYIKWFAYISEAPFVYLILQSFLRGETKNRKFVFSVFGSIGSLGSIYLSYYGESHIGQSLIQLSENTGSAIQFWNNLTTYGHHVVVSNTLGFVSLTFSAILAILASLA